MIFVNAFCTSTYLDLKANITTCLDDERVGFKPYNVLDLSFEHLFAIIPLVLVL